MKAMLLALTALTLTACAPHVRYITRGCVTEDQVAERERAEPPLVKDQLTGKADHDIKPIAGSAVELRSWGRGNLKILRSCI